MSIVFSLVFLLFSFSVFAQDSGDEENVVRIVVPDPEQWERSREKLQQYLDKSTHPLDEDYLRSQMIKKERLKSMSVSPPWDVDEFLSEAIATELAPGARSVNISLAPGLPVMLTLKTISGSDVNVISVQHGAAVSVFRSLEGEEDSSMPRNVLAVKPEVIQGTGNILILTDASTIPLSVGYKIGEPDRRYIDRYSILINDGSHVSESVAELPVRSELMRVLSGIPPENSSRVFFDEKVTAWRTQNNTLWVRTGMKLIYPSRKFTSASLEGVNVYLVPDVPIITLLDGSGRVHQFDREFIR